MSLAVVRIFYSPAGDGGGDGDGGDGGRTVVVGADDSMLNIAKANGFWWSTIWNHSKNADLKALRKFPEVLQEGDEVYIPKLEPKKEPKPTDARHKFKLKGEQATFQIRLKRLGEPRANEDYMLIIDGVIKTGKTDADGKIMTDIPNDAVGGVLKLLNGKEEFPLTIGRLDPHDSPSGVVQRLLNLGHTPEPDDVDGEMPKAMLKAFQTKNKLDVTGLFDALTKSKLQELHQA